MAGVRWDGNTVVPYFDSRALSERTLPGEGSQYPYLTTSDFLEDNMRRFIINVNGKSYDVAVEEVAAGASAPAAAPVPAPAAPAAPAAPVAPAEQPAAAPAAPSAAVADGTKVEAPMPGTILEVKVNVGDKVNEGDVMFVLEAMKMENELMAPCAGTVASVNTSKGTVVNSGDVLGVIG